MNDAALFILATFGIVILAFIGYCVALGVTRTVGEDDRYEYRIVRGYLKGLYYGLWVAGWVLSITFPILGVWLIISWALSIFGS